MERHFCKKPLSEVTRELAACALGREAADTVIENATLVNVVTAELQEGVSVAFRCGRIAYVGPSARHCVGERTKVVDAEGRYLAPGFLDGHIHVESSMCSAGEYARAVVPHGTVGIYWDPHEVCNVLGIEGVRLMSQDAERTPLKAMVTVPSCVPAVPGFEDSGAEVTASDIAEMMGWDGVDGLGEMMNYPGVLAGDDGPHDEIKATLEADGVVTGHYASADVDRGLCAYVASGARCCHESTDPEEALAKMRLGMYAQFREGSAWRDLADLAKLVTEAPKGFDTRYACLVSDDVHPRTLMEHGHLDHVVRRAVEEGIDPITAIQMVTVNTAQCFFADADFGIVAPGRCADVVLLDSLEECRVHSVFIDGEEVARDGKALFELPPFEYPSWAVDTMHVKDAVDESSFAIPAPEGAGSAVACRAIEVTPARAGTTERVVELPVVDGLVQGSVEADVLKTFVFERHHATGNKACGFVKGLGIKRGAMASTVAHDAHNLLVVGVDDSDMALAARVLLESGGGRAVVADGKVLSHVPLPIAGLMSDRPVEEVASLVEREERAWEEIGCSLPAPFMTLALVPLACIPELRLTDRGLVDCRTFDFVSLFA